MYPSDAGSSVKSDFFTSSRNAYIRTGRWIGSESTHLQERYLLLDSAGVLSTGVYGGASVFNVSASGAITTALGVTATAGAFDGDSIRFDGTTVGTKLAYHSGLGASYWGALTSASLTSQGTISGVAGTFTGTLSANSAGGLQSNQSTFSMITSTVNTVNNGKVADSTSDYNVFGRMNIWNSSNQTSNILIDTGNIAPLTLSSYNYQTTGGGAFIQGNRYVGRVASPSAVRSGDVITGLFGAAYNGSALGNNTVAMRFFANQNHTVSAAGTYIDWGVTENNATSRSVSMILDRPNAKPRLTLGSVVGTSEGTIVADTTVMDNLVYSKGMVLSDSSFTINERSTTPTLPASNTQMHMYMKGDKVVWVINAAGTPRYYYFDATATSNQSIIYSATAP